MSRNESKLFREGMDETMLLLHEDIDEAKLHEDMEEQEFPPLVIHPNQCYGDILDSRNSAPRTAPTSLAKTTRQTRGSSLSQAFARAVETSP